MPHLVRNDPATAQAPTRPPRCPPPASADARNPNTRRLGSLTVRRTGASACPHMMSRHGGRHQKAQTTQRKRASASRPVATACGVMVPRRRPRPPQSTALDPAMMGQRDTGQTRFHLLCGSGGRGRAGAVEQRRRARRLPGCRPAPGHFRQPPRGRPPATALRRERPPLPPPRAPPPQRPQQAQARRVRPRAARRKRKEGGTTRPRRRHPPAPPLSASPSGARRASIPPPTSGLVTGLARLVARRRCHGRPQSGRPPASPSGTTAPAARCDAAPPRRSRSPRPDGGERRGGADPRRGRRARAGRPPAPSRAAGVTAAQRRRGAVASRGQRHGPLIYSGTV